MRAGKLALGLAILSVWTLKGQVVPDWYVVELSDAPVEQARGAGRIRESQMSVRALMTARLGRRAEVKDTTEVVMNSLIVRSTAGEAALAAVPGVRRVWPVYELHTELDRAIDLLRIRQAWEAIGGSSRAGAGVKIGILDTGLDIKHPAFQSTEMVPPPGFPKAKTDEVRSLLNGKVIVYRTYEEMAGFPESSEDFAGHGTAVAMAAAGLRVKAPQGEIEGAAPGAWLGIYKIFAGANGDTSNSAIALKALDDAAADGMDVVNLSFGFQPQVRPESDVLRTAVERASGMGVMLVKAMGNSGPVRFSGSGPNVGSYGLTAGASWSDRMFSSGLRVNQGNPFAAIAGNGPAPAGPITAPLKDVAKWDASGLACNPLKSEGGLTGAVALILRGDCTFETKLRMAEEAGAVAAVIYTHAASPNAGSMSVGDATLPAVMISNRDGLNVKAALREKPESVVEITFDENLPFVLDSDGISDFSSRGPGVDGQIRPDLLAVGEDILTATQSKNQKGELYAPSGFGVANGTSFAAPLISGAYATLKAARPGLPAAQYRSLLVNSSQRFPALENRPAPVQVGGAGRMDLMAALRSNLVMDPVSISFGTGGQRVDASRTVRVKNIGANAGTWSVSVDSADELKATVQPEMFPLGPGEEIDLEVRLPYASQAGEYQGFLLLRRDGSREEEGSQRLPYWYGVPSGTPASITVIPSAPASGEAGSLVRLFVLITDAIGASVPAATPAGKVLEGTGEFLEISAADLTYPGYWIVRVRLGSVPGQLNRYRIESGEMVREVSIRTN